MIVKFDIPGVSVGDEVFSQYWLKTLFIQAASERYQIQALTSTFVRLTESSVTEYVSGAEVLRAFWRTHTSLNLGAAHRATTHFENCLSTVVRATNAFRRLRGDKLNDPVASVVRKKNATFATDACFDPVRAIRNQIHHTENEVLEGRIGVGESFALHANGPEGPHPSQPGQTIKTIDRLIIGSTELKFQALARILEEMVCFVVLIGNTMPNSGRSTPGEQIA